MHNATLILLIRDELPALRLLLPRLPLTQLQECIAIDGGSVDGSRELLKQWGIRVIDQSGLGWGAAARTGLLAAQGHIRVLFSPDGNHQPETVLPLIQAIEAGAEMAIASRFLPASVHQEEGQFWRLRLRGARALTWLAQQRVPSARTLTDLTQSFRAFSREAQEQLSLRDNNAELSYALSLQALKAGLRVVEVPTLEGQRLVGHQLVPTHLNPLPHLQVLLREST
ncbi:MAG: glycosyltransferase family 2 protein [Myxococcota bacterium]